MTRWSLKAKPQQTEIDRLSSELSVAPLVATLLLQRGITTFEEARDFFRPKLENLHDPYLMKDMDKAVERIESAIASEEFILVFGDYDVDGTTAVSLMSAYLKSLYPHVATYIPDRYKEGYGISFQGIDYAEENGISLIIALDCGIKSTDHVTYAKAKGIDFIICDHHRPGSVLPQAVAVLDPKRADCGYPYKELCGCGVGFKLIQAIGRNRGQDMTHFYPYLDLVVTAIAADIVPITGENRILAYYGLKVVNSQPRAGIKALLTTLKKKEYDIADMVFTVAPRINAAGRIRHGNHAVEILSEDDPEAAAVFAGEIEQYNKDRRELDRQITVEALQQIADNEEKERYTTVVYRKDWHKGVIGIVASRLIETYYRPTLVFTKSGEKFAASARSVPGFDLYNALESCAEHLEQFGGHMYAAGLTLKEENYLGFKAAFEEAVKATLPEGLRQPEIEIDAQARLSDFTPKLIRILKQFEPFGPGNMTPLFLSPDLVDTGFARTVGEQNDHLRLFVTQGDTPGFAAIGFGLGKKEQLVSGRKTFAAVYSVEENEWNGNVSTQLRLRDVKAQV